MNLTCVSKSVGKIRVFNSRRAWTSPELISVSPLAVIGGQETSVVLRGRNLITTGTKYVDPIEKSVMFNISLAIHPHKIFSYEYLAGLIALTQMTTQLKRFQHQHVKILNMMR